MSHIRLLITPLIALVGLLYCTAAFAESAASVKGENAKVQASADLPEPPAGKIDLVSGEVSLLQVGKPARRALVGDAVNEGDTLVTGKDSEAHVTMLDSGFIALRSSTKVTIASYKADGSDDDNGVFKLVAGGLRSITGWIGKYNQKSYKVQTPTAIIGIRGTDHETRYIPVGSPEGEPGTYDKVFIGETSIQTDAGQTNVDADQAGFVSSGADQHPRVLAHIPGFFRPGPHEDLINKKHAEIQKMIEQRREERRKVVAEKRAALEAARAELQAQKEKDKEAGEERKVAAHEQRQDTETQLALMHEMGLALQKKQKALQDLHRAVQEKVAGGMARNSTLREQFKAVRELAIEIHKGYQEIQSARKNLYEKNIAANDARTVAADQQRVHTEEQLAILNEQGKTLQDRQRTIEDMRQAIQKKSAGAAANNEDLSKQRKDLRAASDAVDKEYARIRDALNALFENNITTTEARMAEAAEQRRQSDQQFAALNEKESSLQARQKDNEEAFEAAQERAASEQGKLEELQEQFKAVREAAEAARQGRKEIQDLRKALHEKNAIANAERQQAIMDQLKALREKHQQVQEKSIDLQQERESMQKEIRALYEQEQRRYREELMADRQQRDTSAQGDVQVEANPEQ